MWNWIIKDSDGVFFIYYVCCVGNSDMIDILVRDGVRFDVKFLNGFIFVYLVVICC